MRMDPHGTQATADALGLLKETAGGHLIAPLEWVGGDPERERALIAWLLLWSEERVISVSSDNGDDVTWVRIKELTDAVRMAATRNDDLWYARRVRELEDWRGPWSMTGSAILNTLLLNDRISGDALERLARSRRHEVRKAVAWHAVQGEIEVGPEILDRWSRDRSRRVRDAARPLFMAELTL